MPRLNLFGQEAQRHKGTKAQRGSALVLVVLLTSILAIVGTLFMFSSRIESLSTTSVVHDRDLNLAIETIVSRLSDELVRDTPGVAGQEYYDYPGDKDMWLASTEPYDDGGRYKWAQITDLTRDINEAFGSAARRNVEIEPTGLSTTKYVRQYPDITLDKNGTLLEQSADADGDGIADARWIVLDDVTSSKGESVYAAIRIIDNCGFVNVNTAYKFPANSRETKPKSSVVEANEIDGSSLLQINLASLAKGTDRIEDISRARSGEATPTENQLAEYEEYVIWRLSDPCEDYVPFDISDELELRYRFCIDSPAEPRLEARWSETIGNGAPGVEQYPYDGTNGDLDGWEDIMSDPNYNRQHMMTVYSTDRIITAAEDPNFRVMLNVNLPDPNLDLDGARRPKGAVDANNYYDDKHIDDEPGSWLRAKDIYWTLLRCIPEPNDLRPYVRKRIKRELAQLAVNMVDWRDQDIDPTSLDMRYLDVNLPSAQRDFMTEEFVFGNEPYPVITQVAIRIDPCDPCNGDNYYAVELFNPFDQEIELDDDGSYYFALAVTDVNRFMDPCDPNTQNSITLVQIPLIPSLMFPSVTTVMEPNEYIVVTTDRFEQFLHIDPDPRTYIIPVDPCVPFVLSSGYKKTRSLLGGPDIIDPNFVDAHNVVVKRWVRPRKDENTTKPRREIYLDRQLIYKDWVRWKSDPNEHLRFYGRDFDLKDSPWWDVAYPNMVTLMDDPNFIQVFNKLGNRFLFDTIDLHPRPEFDIAVPYDTDTNLVTVGDIARLWTEGPKDRLIDPNDANSFAESEIFDVNALDVPDLNDPSLVFDPNDSNMLDDPDFARDRLAKFNPYLRTVPEMLLFISRSLEFGNEHDEDIIRLNLADPDYSNLFQYITVFDPNSDDIDNDQDGARDSWDIYTPELKIPGRININTAPRFVLEQLPWMAEDYGTGGDLQIAESIVEYRDGRGRYDPDRYSEIKLKLHRFFTRKQIREDLGFGSIGELNLVVGENAKEQSIRYYALDPGNLKDFPDLTLPKGVGPYEEDDSDFEERDIIFSRISNLITVRSDIFTAYILVRLGTDGPQKRAIAILDRSNVYTTGGRVKVIALHPVEDPR